MHTYGNIYLNGNRIQAFKLLRYQEALSETGFGSAERADYRQVGKVAGRKKSGLLYFKKFSLQIASDYNQESTATQPPAAKLKDAHGALPVEDLERLTIASSAQMSNSTGPRTAAKAEDSPASSASAPGKWQDVVKSEKFCIYNTSSCPTVLPESAADKSSRNKYGSPIWSIVSEDYQEG